jgi:type IV secretory pathway TrbD component
VGGEVHVSELSQRVQESIGAVQDKLYDEVVRNGWYERRPDATRNTYILGALAFLIVAVVATGVLAAFTTFGLLGLVLVALGLGLVFVGQEMPARTAKGSALLAGLGALRSDLLSQPTDQMPAGRRVAELSEVLPYAVVLGGADRWLAAIVATDDDETADPHDLPWYHGPEDWHLRDLPGSLRNFITTVSGNLFAR